MTAEEFGVRAPISAEFARQMRSIFADVKLVRVQEGDVRIGKDDKAIYARCLYDEKGKPYKTHGAA